LELGVEEAAAGEWGERKMGFLGGVQTRREARLLLSESPQRLYSAKVKRRRAGGEASLPRRERGRARRLEREGDGSEEGLERGKVVVCVGSCGVVNLVGLSYFLKDFYKFLDCIHDMII
jgi:hypothetical protein